MIIIELDKILQLRVIYFIYCAIYVDKLYNSIYRQANVYIACIFSVKLFRV